MRAVDPHYYSENILITDMLETRFYCSKEATKATSYHVMLGMGPGTAVEEWKQYTWLHQCSVERSKKRGVNACLEEKGEARSEAEAVDSRRYILPFTQ